MASAALYLNALPYLYEWMTTSSARSLLKGLAISLSAAAAHHVTLLFGVFFFAVPVVWTAYLDARDESVPGSVAGVLSRAAVFAIGVGVGVGVVLLPYWLALIQHPIHQIPIPHDSRANFLLNSITAVNYFVIPYGMLHHCPPVHRDSSGHPRGGGGHCCSASGWLLFSVWVVPLLCLDGCWDAPIEILTFERFTFWATLLAMPFVGVLAVGLLDRFRSKAAVGLALASVATIGAALFWLTANPYRSSATINVSL